MQTMGTVFQRPQTPAAKCLHLVRFNPIITRSELVEATGLSQPTITRATAALLNIGLLRQRTDLTRSHGRGRPTVPLEVADNGWMLAGIAIGTTSTYVGLYDTRGRIIREDDLTINVADNETDDFIEHVMAGVNRLSAGIERRLVSVGVTTSGTIADDGLVYAPNLGWDGMDIAARLNFQFGVPVTVTSAVPAILGSETQAAEQVGNTPAVLVLFADDSLGAALSDADGVRSLPLPDVAGHKPSTYLVTSAVQARINDADADAERDILNERAHLLAQLTATLVEEYSPATVIVAGGAFYDDTAAPKLFASQVRSLLDTPPHLRLIPSHREIVRAIARAVALDPLLRTPLEIAPR